jgi:hypothetical protein
MKGRAGADNRLCFEKKTVKDPSDIIFSACVFIPYWAGLYLEESQAMINAGVETMIQTTLLILRRQPVEPRRIDNGPTRIVEEGEDEQDDGFGGFKAT